MTDDMVGAYGRPTLMVNTGRFGRSRHELIWPSDKICTRTIWLELVNELAVSPIILVGISGDEPRWVHIPYAQMTLHPDSNTAIFDQAPILFTSYAQAYHHVHGVPYGPLCEYPATPLAEVLAIPISDLFPEDLP